MGYDTLFLLATEIAIVAVFVIFGKKAMDILKGMGEAINSTIDTTQKTQIIISELYSYLMANETDHDAIIKRMADNHEEVMKIIRQPNIKSRSPQMKQSSRSTRPF